MYRRSLLRTVGVATVVAIAGCADGGDTDGSSPTPTTQPTETETPTATETPTSTATDTPTPTPTSPPPDVAQVVDVGGEGLQFTPESFEIAVGDSVLWEWNGNGHNVVPDSIPTAADWSGTEGGAGTTYDTGHQHRYTFEVAGAYSYYCAPHRNAGMTGSFSVRE